VRKGEEGEKKRRVRGAPSRIRRRAHGESGLGVFNRRHLFLMTLPCLSLLGAYDPCFFPRGRRLDSNSPRSERGFLSINARAIESRVGVLERYRDSFQKRETRDVLSHTFLCVIPRCIVLIFRCRIASRCLDTHVASTAQRGNKAFAKEFPASRHF